MKSVEKYKRQWNELKWHRPPDTVLIHSEWAGRHFYSLKLEGQSGVRARDLRLSKQAALTTTPDLRPHKRQNRHDVTKHAGRDNSMRTTNMACNHGNITQHNKHVSVNPNKLCEYLYPHNNLSLCIFTQIMRNYANTCLIWSTIDWVTVYSYTAENVHVTLMPNVIDLQLVTN